MPTQHIIKFGADGYQLVGTLHLPHTSSPPLVIGCHGLLANRDSQKQISLAAACNKIGWAYLRFDHRGCGQSQGEFSEVTSLRARRQDLYHAVKTMQHHSGVGPLTGLFGSSFGGSVVLAYAAKYPSPAKVTYAAPVDSATINHTSIRNKEGKSPSLNQLTDALSFSLEPSLRQIKNTLVVHSQNDETVPVRHAHQIHDRMNKPKKLFIFKGGDHRMSNSDHQKRLQKLVLSWFTSR